MAGFGLLLWLGLDWYYDSVWTGIMAGFDWYYGWF